MSRVTLFDNTQTAIVKMCDGNPGAMKALVELVKCAERVDPGCLWAGIDSCLWTGVDKILFLDTLEIYGTDIYILWNDICNRDTPKMIAVLIATKFGYLSPVVLKDACHRQDRSGRSLIPVDELYAKVVEKLPDFDLENRTQSIIINNK